MTHNKSSQKIKSENQKMKIIVSLSMIILTKL